MTNSTRCLASALLGLASWTAFSNGEAYAQTPKRGEVFINSSTASSGEERTSQSNLWVLDVYYKPMRMIRVELTNPKTGEKKLEHVWYIAYRVVHRKSGERVDEKAPKNEIDPPVSSPLFIPEGTLVVTDNDRQEVFPDQVIPEALAAINKREKANYKTAVSVVAPLPEASELGSGDDGAMAGVMMWRGIDPEADRYTVFLTGFSNGIRKVNGPDGNPIIQTKTIMQKYWRRGDRFDLKEPETIADPQDPESHWIYR